MKKAFIMRGSHCFGDMILISWTPRQLKEKLGYDWVTVSCWEKNKCIFENNPYIDELFILDDVQERLLDECWKEWEKEYTVFDFRYSVEIKYLKNSTENIHSPETLRKLANGKNYFRDALKEYDLSGKKGELYLSDKEKENVEQYKSLNKKRICWQLEGTGRNKVLTFLPAYINEISKVNPEIEHWIVGNRKPELGNLTGKIIDKRTIWSARDSIAHIPIFDLVVGPESFMINAAGALDVPTMIFFSHSAPENLNKFYKNTYSIIPNCDCSPCYLIHKDFRCTYDLQERKKARKQERKCLLRDKFDSLKSVGYKCTIMIDHKKVIDRILKILE